jgi:hypothetical protein
MIPSVVTAVVLFWDVNIEPNLTSSVILATPSIVQGAFNITWPPLVRNSTTYPGTVVPFYATPWTPDPPSSLPPGIRHQRQRRLPATAPDENHDWRRDKDDREP